MKVSFIEVMVQTYPKGFEEWQFYRAEYGGHAEACLFESHIWLPPKAKIKELEYLFQKWQQPTYEEYIASLPPRKKLLRNRVKCKKCGITIESRYRHDFVECECGSVFVDGGLDYMRIGGDENNFENLSEWEDICLKK